MSPDSAPTRSNVALRGSSQIVSEFFEYSINSILYQRGIYPPEDFQIVKKYGLNMLITNDEDIKAYVRKIMNQLHRWVSHDKISKLIVAIISKDSGDVVERWQFDLEISTPKESEDKGTSTIPLQKTKEDIQKEIQAIIRQITASVTFLPTLETGDYTFNVLVYADANAKVPSEWIDSDSKEIQNGEKVKFKSFSTNSHKVDTLVSYKLNNE
ncbi:Mitotic spindle assembly checkpoint protein MAD2A [Wickerhamomyces ciferrii]|uniref:Mitotic spindle assembly checkpoint protein MAD2A n=1 Tax=Wickerhamomyces ciferrii (strain ATCC 14091 / BCRC 22168 / CBS 111 / JCM 3599 / NBRC 0793 / NRRL Y-1031 F-60-10) TaxID=1206466 RepID=K0KI89_WICCF|nr:Mitotic spindle assembly checkpoint protein MAD2A [Wickerhamomyces ciferrii]CCH40863.1 Mitotic spindle assembly checkpoint protein MAD2A [Wickerhamomyces ciferrii]